MKGGEARGSERGGGGGGGGGRGGIGGLKRGEKGEEEMGTWGERK